MKLIAKLHTMGLCKNNPKDVRRWRRIGAQFRRVYLAQGNFEMARKMNKGARFMRKRDFKDKQ